MANADLSLPINKGERRIFSNYLKKVDKENPLRFYVGSCPDYEHNGQYYTHGGIGGSVPLLTHKHLTAAQNLFSQLEDAKVPYEYILMVADVEAMDQVFCDKFTGGDQGRFLALCNRSVLATAEFIRDNFSHLQYGQVRSSSFFSEFGQDNFMDYERRYKDLLHNNYQSNGSMRSRIYRDTYARIEMYRAMYDRVLPYMSTFEREDFLIGRTERTMAQYLALGRLVGQRQNASIICHPTLNISMINDRNKLLLAEDNPLGVQPTVPVFPMNRRVYR